MSRQLSLFPAGSLRLHTSNQLENLAAQLNASLCVPLASPFTPEVIIVQSRGIARWLALQLAAHAGICMNCVFPFPREFFVRTLRTFFPELPDHDVWTPEILTWRLHRLLPSLLERAAFAPVRQYLAESDPLKTFQLAEKLARLFDQYLLYRPEMLLAWARERQPAEWQAILWRELTAQIETPHLAHIAQMLPERMAEPPTHGTLPQRISVFGISSLPPLHLRMLFLLAQHVEVNLFWLQPSQEYFGHDLSPKLRARLAARELSGQEQTGHALLASMGKLNRDFTELRLDLDEQLGPLLQEAPAEFLEPDADSMLHVLQRDILYAQHRGTKELPAWPVSTHDQSIVFHACHSPGRELEVLYDQLLARFAADPTLRPRDILVMTPDIEKYAPFIHAIFGSPEDPARRLPYGIADRRSRSASPLLETFIELLAVPGSRCAATEIYALLGRPPIRQKFHLTDDELSQVKQWIVQSGIRWGIDAAHRRTLGLPERAENTWRAGFDRLLLGFAMPGGGRVMFEHILPFDEVEGSGGELLGRFLTATEHILALATSWKEARTILAWRDAIHRVLDQLFHAETAEDVADLRLLRGTLEQLHHQAMLANADDQLVEFRVLRAQLTGALEQSEARGGFLTGGITFCALQPMRSVPSRIIVLLGMNDDAFPRHTPKLAFDLLAARPECGDRSSRDDDRYLFLEALLSAREQLYCSYLGRSTLNNSPTPPSVLFSELLDDLDQSFTFPRRENARSFLITHHRLHAFSARYFDASDPRLFSYSEANAAAARALIPGAAAAAPSFFPGPLPALEEPSRIIELAELIKFFGNPSHHFLLRQLGISREERREPMADDEPFALNSLEQYHLRQELVVDVLAGHEAETRIWKARHILPHGSGGAAHFLGIQGVAAEFFSRVQSILSEAKAAEPLLITIPLGEFTLSGTVQPLYQHGLVHFRSADLKPKDRLRAWIMHLALSAADSRASLTSTLIGHDATLHFPPHREATALLIELVALYRRGLQSPLRFFPISSLAYAEAVLFPTKSRKTPLQHAWSAWRGSYENPGEKDGVDFSFCFGDGNPLGEDFPRLSLAVYGPLLRHHELQ